MISIRLLGLALMVPSAACAAQRGQERVSPAWVGHTLAELVRAWGTPHHDYALDDGGRAIGYFFVGQPIRGPEPDQIVHARDCMVNLEVNQDGVIESAAVSGARCRFTPYEPKSTSRRRTNH
jgi:hypothetical protein